MIRSGTAEEIRPDSGEWLFIDVGFSSKGRSCGVLCGERAVKLTFAETCNRLVAAGTQVGGRLNLLIEAPLSVAFSFAGNPVGRSVERVGSQHRYWYEGLGCVVMTSALYLLRALHDSRPLRDVHLFEGFVSFKPKGQGSSHCGDVDALRSVVMNRSRDSSAIVKPDQLAVTPTDRVVSAFAVAGLDFGVPPIVRVSVDGSPAIRKPAVGSERRHADL